MSSTKHGSTVEDLMEPTLVIRRLRPGVPGTQKLLLRHGSDLVCVRYRKSLDGLALFTTVELIVDRRPSPESRVDIALDWRESNLRKYVASQGGQWDVRRKVWTLSLREARKLKLMRRVIK
jgi:hypothetical protein